MKLVSVTVENFRSITTARRIPISQLTTLVGPNNEGKSNILRALVIAMNSLIARRSLGAIRFPTRRRRAHSNRYNWRTDCPLKLQNKKDKGSTITLEFDLSDGEVDEFYESIGSRLNGTLPISFSFQENSESVNIAKPGKGHKVLNSKASRIAEFIAGKVEIQYIPAVRTADSSQSIVEELVATELQKIESDPKYVQALADIAALQEPILEELSNNITATMKGFLPNIQQARIEIEQNDRSNALRGISEIIVDDGAETPLVFKGDGVQSLAAIALMRHVSQLLHSKKEVIIALEEPESHLHPMAIRQLRSVLMELSNRHQVVLTTHNPIFASRSDVHQNIIVRDNRAFPADAVKDVRDVLGVRLDDNLTSAEIVIIVEGEEDRIALMQILSEIDQAIEVALKAGRIAFDVLGGAGNLSYRIRMHTDVLCKVHAFLDDDIAGRQSYDKAKKEGLLASSAVNFTKVGGKTDAELEDLYVDSVYEDILFDEIGLKLVANAPDKSKKWSERVKNLLKKAGKPSDDVVLLSIKIKVAHSAAQLGLAAIHPSKRGPIDSLANSIKKMLS